MWWLDWLRAAAEGREARRGGEGERAGGKERGGSGGRGGEARRARARRLCDVRQVERAAATATTHEPKSRIAICACVLLNALADDVPSAPYAAAGGAAAALAEAIASGD